MSKNEIEKKNISANALSDDNLENVAGGYDILYADDGKRKESLYKFNSEEIKKLVEHGYTVDTKMGESRVTNDNGWSISPEDIDRVLGY